MGVMGLSLGAAGDTKRTESSEHPSRGACLGYLNFWSNLGTVLRARGSDRT